MSTQLLKVDHGEYRALLMTLLNMLQEAGVLIKREGPNSGTTGGPVFGPQVQKESYEQPSASFPFPVPFETLCFRFPSVLSF